MRLLFWQKKKRSHTEPILDGIKEVQLYICPTCGKKVETTFHCECCGGWLCPKCGEELNLWFVGRYSPPHLMGKRVCKSCYTQLSSQFVAIWETLRKTRPKRADETTEEAVKMT